MWSWVEQIRLLSCWEENYYRRVDYEWRPKSKKTSCDEKRCSFPSSGATKLKHVLVIGSQWEKDAGAGIFASRAPDIINNSYTAQSIKGVTMHVANDLIFEALRNSRWGINDSIMSNLKLQTRSAGVRSWSADASGARCD